MTTEVDEQGFLKTEGEPAPNVEQPGESNEAPSGEPPKKRRGRPPKNAGLTAEQIESGGQQSTAPPKKKANRQTYSTADIGAMAKQLVGLHQIGAMMTGIPEVQISEQEAGMLASAIVNVSQQYDLAVDGKTGALIQILGTAALIYVPRMGAISARAKANKAAKMAAQENASI